MRGIFTKPASTQRDRGYARCNRLCGLLIGLVFFALAAQAQPASTFHEAGRFYVQNFGPEDYDAATQNWDIVEGPEGFLYVGNNDGVLEYDGVSWRLIPVANRSVVRSLAVDAEGRIVVGAADELGYLAPDALGRMGYVSLVDHIPPEDRAFAYVWSIERVSGNLYFRTWERLFRWDGSEMKVWRAETVFAFSFVVDDTVYVRQEDIGWMRIDDDSLVVVPGDDSMVPTPGDEPFFVAMVTQGEGARLFVSLDQGIFRCPPQWPAGEPCTSLGTGATDPLTDLEPFHATMLPEGILAVGTLQGGVVLLDRAGLPLHTIDEASGLRDQYVTCTYVDRQGGLWLCLNNGLARVETGAAVSYFDKTMGLPGSVLDVARHGGSLYAATSLGVYRLQPAAGGAAPRFLPCPGLTKRCWTLLSTPQGLLATCADGVYDVEARERTVAFDTAVLAISRTRRDPTLLYLGLAGGLARMRLREGRWTGVDNVEGVREQVSSIAEDAAGRLWIGTRNEGVVRVDPVATPPVVTRFGTEHGLPPGLITATTLAGRVVFISRDGFFRLDETIANEVRFLSDPAFEGFQPSRSKRVFLLDEDDQGRVWIAGGEASAVGQPQPGGGYAWQSTALRRAPMRDVFGVHAEVGGPLWVGGPHGLIRLDTTRTLEPPTRFSARIRRITTADSLLFDGRRAGGEEAQLPAGGMPVETSVAESRTEPAAGGRTIAWPYRDNALRFAFAAPRFAAPESTKYRTRLDGLEDDWSTWSYETDKDYTNLWEGRYVFHVQARDVYGNLSREDGFAFRILPPWYRTWWAYGLYGLMLAGVIAAYVRSHREELRKERQISNRLREVDKLKDEFLANTSHELRTPLLGMTGLAESLIDGAAGEVPETVKTNLSMIVTSGRRLSRLVDDILDFSKLRHKSLELAPRPVDLRPLVEVVLTLSRPLVGSKELKLENAVPADLPAVEADENRLEQILHNLVGNAVKFTESGSIEVSATAAGEHIVVRVADTGIGIPADKQAQIFDAFEQVDASVERAYGGTGLGLAVTRQLVALHGGEIRVASRPGEGSVFSFTLPFAAASPVVNEPAPAATRVATVSEANVSEGTVSEANASEANVPATHSGVVASEATAGGPRILVVDDDPINLQVLRNYLAVEGYDLTMAPSGGEALRLLGEETFDLVLLDVMMPKLSGYEVCRALRERYPIAELPVLFLTAKSRDADVVSGMALGANDYLAKPISKGGLLARIRPHLELLHVHRNLENLVAEKVAQVKVLSGLLPICAECKKIRDDEGYWNQLEVFIDRHSEAQFSHSFCPDCLRKYLGASPDIGPKEAR